MPIAIVGMGCRFAGNVTGPERLWELLKSGQSGWSEIPESRFATSGILHPQKDKIGSVRSALAFLRDMLPPVTNVRGGYFLGTDPGAFDASFFNLSTEVASTLDPQIRMTLEVVFEAMESAGIKLPDIQGSDTSVFAGCMVRDYHDTLARDPHTLPRYFMTGNAATMAANRVSHFYDLRGPSMTIDTGCSTTLTALHLACRSLQAGESGSAIVTGANLMLNPDVFVSMSTIGFLSPDGISYSFDHRANGYGRGDGIAAVILKRLDHAVAAGDPIRAIIRGSALNQDGKTPTITTPSQEAQERLMGACYRSCGLDPGETGFVEAHGTGTPTGDPIEVTAIANIIASASPPGSDPLLLGSVKSAIGHTEAASGLASVIKVVCALEAGVVPPNVNFEELNPKLRLQEWNMQVPTTVRPWHRRGATRRASINNFGFGGANAHVILEEYRPESMAGLLASCSGMASSVAVNGHSNVNGYPQVNEHDPTVTNGMKGENGLRGEEMSSALQHTKSNGHHVGAMPAPDSADGRVFVIYGKDQASCQSRVSDLRLYLSLRNNEEQPQTLHDLAYTLSEHRTVMPWMVACRSGDVLGLQEALESGKPAAARIPSQPPRLGIVFNGQGAQWHAMGRELIHRYDVFRASIERMGVYIREMGATWSLMDELLRDEDTSNVQNFEYSLPLCSSVQIALVDLLRSWGIEPSAVTGHSSGEVAAAYAAGALDARSAIAIPYLRGALSAETDQIIGKGGMIAVGASRQKVQEYIDRVRSGSIVVACVNSQNSITASGDLSAVRELEDMLVCDKVFCRRLRINGAFHSHHMAPISAKYMDQLRPVLKPRRGPRDVVFSSSMTGGLLQDLDVLSTPEYWNNNMLRAVEFEASFRAMCVGARTGQGGAEGSPSPAQQIDVVVELGPHGALGGPIQDMLSLPAFEGTQISYLTGLVRNKSAIETTHSLVCELLRKGWPVNLSAVNSPGTERRARVLSDLPTYPWNHSARFWMEPRANKAWRRQVEPSHDILGRYQSTSDPFVPTWRNVLRLSEMPWLGDHVVGSKVVFPAAGYISMVSEAAYRLAGRYLPDERVQELRLRNVEFLSALHVPEAEGQEVQLTVMRRSEGLSSWAGWLDFRVSSVSANNDWLLHCQGSFKLDTVSTAAEADHHHAADPKMPLKPLTVTRRVDPADLWTALANVGIRHGPAFRKISTVESTRENSVVTFQSTDPSSPHQGGDLLHPATLDSVFQAAYTVLQGLGSALESAFIPRAIKSMSLRRQGTLGPVFEAHLRPGRVGVQSFDTGVTVFAASPAGERNVNAVLHMDGLLYQSLDLDGASAPRSDRGSLCSTVTWAPDPSFASSMRAAVVSMKHTITSSEKEAMVDLQRAVLHYVHDAVRALTDQDVDRLAWHHKKHHRWMLQLLQRAAQNELGPESSKWLEISADDKAALLDRVAAANVNGEMISRLGPRAVALMKGEVAPLELMVEGELLYRYYVGALKWDRSTGQVARLVRLLAHKNPRATILEIGGGTGGGTQAILDALGRGSGGDDGQGALFERYDFTDISQGFFEAAQKRFEPWRDLMTFRKLDIEADAVAQGFEAGSYDIVVACQCLHATKAMDRTMSNVRRLLKPGGKLVLIETTRDALDVFMAFGFLPGWWLSEEPERVNSPSLTVPFWDQVLRRNGFSGLDMELRDCEDPDFFSFSAMVSTAQGDAYAPAYPQQVVLVCTAQRFPAPWLQALQSRLATVLGYEPPIKALELGSTTTTTFHGETCIYLEELLQPDLLDLDEDGFHGLKTMVTHCDGLLWLTRGAAMESSVPEASLSHGLLRTVRHEAPSKRYIVLDVSA
ncbi:polyketide synthase [Colletotrichum higginsianum]|nr:polyketide synthase [Colletotrichum higginsianum]